MKKLIGLIGATLLMSTLITGGVFAAANHIKIFVNGQEIEPNIQPQFVEDTVMVPVRAIAESLGANVVWDESANSVIITAKDKISKVVTDIPEEGIVLSAVETDGMYRDFTLEVKGHKKFFEYSGWKNVTNPSYAPELLLNDIDHDGKKELIVILTSGYGTGVRDSEAHIINTETLTETYIDNPKTIAIRNVKTNITENEIEITIGDQNTIIDKQKLNIGTAQLFSKIGFGSICRFEVIDDELRVNMPAQISPTVFIGEVQIRYELKDNMYQASNIDFISYSK